MAGKVGNAGMNKFANLLGGMMKEVSDQPLVLDFGIINADYSLQTNTFPVPIPKHEYSVCRCITYDPSVPLTKTYCDGAHSHPDDSPPGSDHVHQVELPEKMYWIRPNDKVLVAWVQNEAVVVDIVLSGDRVG